MKKTVFFAFLIFISAQVFAGFSVNGFGGYASMEPVRINTILEDMYQIVFAPPPTHSFSRLSSGWYAGVDAGYELTQGFSAVLRAEMIQAGQAKLFSEDLSNNYIDLRVDAYTVPVMAGFSYTSPLVCGSLSLGADAVIGCGFASQTWTCKSNTFPEGGSWLSSASLAAELNGKISYKILSFASINFNLGYRLMNAVSFNHTKDSTFVLNTGNKSDPGVSFFGNLKEDVDFSGLNFGAGVSFSL